MADNVTANAGSGGAVFATDDVSGVHYPISKLAFGPLDTANIVEDASTKRLPVKVAEALPAGTNNIGDVDVLSSALPTGASTLAEQQSQTTALQLIDDIVATDGAAAPTKGAMLAGTDGTNAQTIKVDTAGELQVDILTLPSIPAGSNNIGDVDVLTLPALPAGTNNIGDVDVVSSALPTGASTLAEQQSQTTALQLIDDIIATDGAAAPTKGAMLAGTDGTNAQTIKVDTGGELQVDVLTLPALVAGTANIGDVDVLTLPALPAGTNNIGDVDVLTLPAIPAGTNNIGDVDVLTLPGSLTGLAEDAAHVSGDVGVMSLAVRKDTGATIAGTDGDYSPLQVDASGNLRVNIAAGGGGGGTSSTDESAYTPTSSVGTPVMGAADETTPDAAAEGTLAIIRSTLNRALHVNLRDASGNELAVGGGTQYDEDTASGAAEKITMAGVVRKDTAASLVDTDADRTELIVDASGRLHVNVGTSALPTGAATLAEQQTQTTALQLIDDTVATDGSATPTKGILIAGQDGTNAQTIKTDASGELQVDVLTLPALPAGSNNIGDVDVLSSALPTGASTLAEQQTQTTALQLIDDTVATDGAATPTKGILIAGQDGTNAQTIKVDASGELQIDVLTLPALVAGTANIGDVDVLTLPALPAGTNNIGDVDVLTLPNVTLAAGTNTNEVVGDAAHDAAVAGNPNRIAGRARTSDYTAVANDDTADLLADTVGKQVILPFSIPENFTDGVTAAITGTGDTSVIAAPGAGIRLYITSILVTNSHATVGTVVELKDNTTVRYRGYAAPAGGGFSVSFPTPIRLAANVAFNAANVTTGSNTYVSATAYKAP